MTLLLAAFFAFVLVAVTAAGLAYQKWAGEPHTPDDSMAAPESGSYGADLLVVLGKAFGSAPRDGALRSLLFRAGYRSPSAVAMFHGAQVVAGLGMAIILDWAALLREGGAGSLLLPAFCGLGLGYLLPKR